jgi:4-amino-4-deoxy-L-arabinose transferase-like glycosyltransferase
VTDKLTWLLTSTVLFLVLILIYLQYRGVSGRTVAIIAAVAFFAASTIYTFLKRRSLSKQGIAQELNHWRRLAFLIVFGLAVWICLIFRFIRS